MPCFLAILAMFFPRLVIALLAIFSDYIGRGLSSTGYPVILGILGFLFMPFTLLAYVLAINRAGSVSGLYLIVLIIAVLLDLGVVGATARPRKKRTVVRTYRPRA
jgi:hypothetical protein